MATNFISGSGGGGTAASANEKNTRSRRNSGSLTLKDALSYIDLVKSTFQDRPEVYEEFIKTMNVFKAGNLKATEVANRVIRLFAGHVFLAVGFSVFLPDGFDIKMEGGKPVCVFPGLRRPLVSGCQNQAAKPTSTKIGDSTNAASASLSTPVPTTSNNSTEFACDANDSIAASTALFSEVNSPYELLAYKLSNHGFFQQKDKVYHIFIPKSNQCNLIKVIERSSSPDPLSNQALGHEWKERYGYIIGFDMPRVMTYCENNCKILVLFQDDTQESFSIFEATKEDETTPFSNLTESFFRSIQLGKEILEHGGKGPLFPWLQDKLELDQWRRGELKYREVAHAKMGEASHIAIRRGGGSANVGMNDEKRKRRRDSEQELMRSDSREDEKKDSICNATIDTSHLSGLAKAIKVKQEKEEIETSL